MNVRYKSISRKLQVIRRAYLASLGKYYPTETKTYFLHITKTCWERMLEGGCMLFEVDVRGADPSKNRTDPDPEALFLTDSDLSILRIHDYITCSFNIRMKIILLDIEDQNKYGLTFVLYFKKECLRTYSKLRHINYQLIQST